LHVCADKGESKSPAHTGESSEYYGLGIEREMTGKLLKLFFIMASGFCAMIVLLAGGSALAAVTPIQLTNNPANEGRPDVHGNTIVWKRLSPLSGWDIYMYDMYDLENPGEQIITNASGSQINPVTNGISAIWEDWRSGDSDIYMMKVALPLTSAEPEPLVTGPGNQAILSVSGNRLVYVNNTNPLPCLPNNPSYPYCPGTGENDINNNIYAVNLDNPNNPYPVCTEAGSQWQPRISGNKVVWQDKRSGSWDIWMKELPNGPEQQITTDPGNDQVADISGDIVVWRSYRNDRYDIWMKNLGTGVEQPVTSDAAFQNSPRISGDLIVWEDYRNDPNPGDTYYDYDIYMKDLTSGVESILAGGHPIQVRPAVDRETVVWEDNTGGGYDVWMAKVPDTTAPSVGPVYPANGSATGCSSPVISAGYTDNRAGINTGTVMLTVDGQNVTGNAKVTEKNISYQPAALQDGLHTVSLTLDDLSGNSASSSWQFQTSTSHPVLSLSSQRSYWDSYTDYLNHELLVQYHISNSSSDASAVNLQILDSQATPGVIMASATPMDIGELGPGAQVDLVIRYLVPVTVGSFKTTLYASCLDTCGSTYYFPGPPPGW